MPLEWVAYGSTALLPRSPEHAEREIVAILATARRHNGLNDVTGYLALIDNTFLQVLEGEGKALDGIMLRIGFDRRHTDMKVLARGPTQARGFRGWNMGCCLDSRAVQAACAAAGLDEPGIRSASAGQVRALLASLSDEASNRGTELAA